MLLLLLLRVAARACDMRRMRVDMSGAGACVLRTSMHAGRGQI